MHSRATLCLFIQEFLAHSTLRAWSHNIAEPVMESTQFVYILCLMRCRALCKVWNGVYRPIQWSAHKFRAFVDASSVSPPQRPHPLRHFTIAHSRCWRDSRGRWDPRGWGLYWHEYWRQGWRQFCGLWPVGVSECRDVSNCICVIILISNLKSDCTHVSCYITECSFGRINFPAM